MMEILAGIPAYPIEFHPTENRFGLHGLRLMHCLFCGGRLPEQDYRDRSEPNPDELLDATAMVESVQSLDDLVHLLGEPDEASSADESQTPFTRGLDKLVERYPDIYVDDPNDHWTRFARYWKHWPSLYLDVYEYPDGRLEHQIWGQDPSDRPIPTPRASWWSFLRPRLRKT